MSRGAPKCKPPNRACGLSCMKPKPPYPGGRYCKKLGEIAPKRARVRGPKKKSGPGQILYTEKPKCRGKPYTKACGRRCIAWAKPCPSHLHQWERANYLNIPPNTTGKRAKRARRNGRVMEVGEL